MLANKSSIDKILKILKRTLHIVWRPWGIMWNSIKKEVTIFRYIKNICETSLLKFIEPLTKLNPGFMWSFFERNDIPFNLLPDDLLLLPQAQSTRYGVNSLVFLGSRIWNNLLPLKEIQAFEQFDDRIKNLISIRCTCTASQWYIISFYLDLYIY